MLVVALTGGIGAGKSSASALLVERGAVLVDADAVVRELQAAGGVAFGPIVERFGPGVVGADGELDRAALAAIVFADDAARADLNAIVHPLVGTAIAQRLAEHAETDAVVILDVPLLVEGRGYPTAGTIVVDCPPELALERLVTQRGMAAEDAQRRMAAQATREERLAKADFVIDNSAAPADLAAAVDACWAWVKTLIVA